MYPDGICEKIELCEKGEFPYIIHEFKHSYFVLETQQFYKGHSLLLFKRHVRELHELSEKEYLELSNELYIATKAIHKTFKPWKINHQSLGNQDQHIHWHIVPRYETDKYHRSMPMTDFVKGEDDISKYVISEKEAREITKLIRENLA